MINYKYTKENWNTFDEGIKREWVITNGLGSYGGSSLIGGLNRTHQGLLIASLNPPVDRYVVLEQISEWIKTSKNTYDLETSKRCNGKDIEYKNGQEYLTEVVYDGTVTYHYECGSCIAAAPPPSDDADAVSLLSSGIDLTDIKAEVAEFEITKSIALKRNENTVAIGYEFVNNSDDAAEVVITPWFNFREHNTLTPERVPKFDSLRTGDTLSLVPRCNPYVRIDLSVSSGTYYDHPTKYYAGSLLQTEVDLETRGITSHYTPVEIGISVPAHSRMAYSVLCSVVTSDVVQGMALLQQASDCFLNSRSAHKIVRSVRQYYAKLIDDAGFEDENACRLVMSADHFLCKRASTGTETILAGLPWFNDWGRDTMIAFTGLTLCTKRYDDAGQILFTFAEYVKNGLVPNMFPSDGKEPLYNTADASLWYFIAVYKYLKYLRADEKVDDTYMRNAVVFVYKNLFPILREILSAYELGTDFSIRMLNNGLISAGSDLDQVTWMDVRVDDRVMTPRHGCPVEINALWYNALCIMSYLCNIFKQNGSHYEELAEKVKRNFQKAFWNSDAGYLYDVVVYDEALDEYTFRDDSIRPNQIYAVSLPFSLLSSTDERKITECVEKELFVKVGLRSLSPKHPDYHGLYRGSLEKRDEAYHQGTAWGFLLGAFFTAYRKTKCLTRDDFQKFRDFFEPSLQSLETTGCIGGINEVFDGDPPHQGGGCYTQAWSIGEILRSYVEDVLSSNQR